MTYVLDSSVAFKWVVAESDSTKAIRLRDDSLAGLIDLIAPDFFPLELKHALTRSERQGRVQVGQGGLLWSDAMKVGPVLESTLSLVPRAYSIASHARIGIYDCLYLALAEHESCEFLTADDKLVRALQPQFPMIIALSAIP